MKVDRVALVCRMIHINQIPVALLRRFVLVKHTSIFPLLLVPLLNMLFKHAGLWTALAVHAAAQSSGNSNPCKLAASQQDDSIESLTTAELDSDVLYAAIDAKVAYECATSVSLDASDAVAMIDVVKSYLGFQTTLVFNANPPDSYQQPTIDVRNRLEELARRVENGDYDNQYDFDVALQSIFYAVHDGHYSLDMGVYGLFSWLLPDTLVSVSSDGQEIPEVYARSDIRNDVDNASPIVEIEGDSVFSYLASYVNRTGVRGYVEPHAEWNHITWNAASELGLISAYQFTISRGLDSFQQTRVYNGESISGKFANGSSFEWEYQAGSLMWLKEEEYTSADDILKEYVQTPRSGLEGRSARFLHERKSTAQTLNPRNDIPTPGSPLVRKRSMDSDSSVITVPSFPRNPAVSQRNLWQGGFVSGHILEDMSVGVLSIPSFQTIPGELDDAGSSLSFSEAVRKFIRKAKDAKVERIVIDLSGNGGGNILQGLDTFKQLFPDVEPPFAVRGAATPNHNVLGRLLTRIIDSNGSLFSDSSLEDVSSMAPLIALVTTISTDTDGKSWESYDDFFGPVEYNGGNFTNVARYDLSAPEITIPLNQNVTGYGDNTVDYAPPWTGENIILLHDGTCASTCAIFSNLMKGHADVRSVVVGGVPQHGPMQGVGGTRGSNTIPIQSFDLIIRQMLALKDDDDEEFAELLESEDFTMNDLNRLPAPLYDAPWLVRSGQVNTLDIVRPESDEPGMPYQFAYEAAHCRLFYTAAMMRNITELWATAAKYANGDDSVCVRGSTDGYGLRPNVTFVDDPGFNGADIWENANSTSVLDNGNSPDKENDDKDDDSNDDEGIATSLSTSFRGLAVAFGIVLIISL